MFKKFLAQFVALVFSEELMEEKQISEESINTKNYGNFFIDMFHAIADDKNIGSETLVQV